MPPSVVAKSTPSIREYTRGLPEPAQLVITNSHGLGTRIRNVERNHNSVQIQEVVQKLMTVANQMSFSGFMQLLSR